MRYGIVDEKTPVPQPSVLGRAKAHLSKRLDHYGKIHQASARKAGPTGKPRVLSVYDRMQGQGPAAEEP